MQFVTAAFSFCAHMISNENANSSGTFCFWDQSVNTQLIRPT